MGIKLDDWNADHYVHAIKSWGLNDTQMKVLKIMVYDIYMDGWVDGVAHRTNLTPDKYRERLTNDIQNSWTRLIVEGVDKQHSSYTMMEVKHQATFCD